MWRLGKPGWNLIFPEASTPVEAVTMAVRARSTPRGVSTSTTLVSQEIRVAGAENWTGSPAASLPSSVPTPCRQNASTSRSADLAKFAADTSLSGLAQPNGPSTNSMVGRHSPRSFGSACAQETSALP